MGETKYNYFHGTACNGSQCSLWLGLLRRSLSPKRDALSFSISLSSLITHHSLSLLCAVFLWWMSMFVWVSIHLSFYLSISECVRECCWCWLLLFPCVLIFLCCAYFDIYSEVACFSLSIYVCLWVKKERKKERKRKMVLATGMYV